MEMKIYLISVLIISIILMILSTVSMFTASYNDLSAIILILNGSIVGMTIRALIKNKRGHE